MKTYKHMTVGEVIDFLEDQDPEAFITGLSSITGSYRGYYDRVAIEPGKGVPVRELLEEMRDSVGTEMHGYKGGTYPYSRDTLVYIAHYGKLGPMLIGLDVHGNVIDPVGEEETW